LRDLLGKYRVPFLDHDTGVGGRYSALTNVGLLPAAMLGLDIAAVREGAGLALAPVLAKKPAAQVPAAVGAALSVALSEGKGKSISVLMAYCDRLQRFTHWYVQLWAESLGKNGKGTTPVAALGPVDQHSQLQLFIGTHRRGAGQTCGRAGLRWKNHRRSGGGGRPRHRRDTGEEWLSGADNPHQQAR
jgi:glucose-6-phosphate isomerase